MDKDNRTITDLPLFSCHFVELPDSRVDCSLSNPQNCVRCPILGRFVTGGGLDEFGTTGHVVSLTEWIFTLFLGFFGTITNILIINIIRRQNSGRAFDILLVALACIDLIGSITAVVAATSTVAIFENWDRGITAQYLVYFGTFTCFFTRSGSSFMTVLITTERYIMISFPVQSSHWFTEGKTKIMAVIVVIWAAFMAYPRFGSFAIVENDIGWDIPSIMDLDYVILATNQEQFWYRTTGGFFDKIDFWVPLPILLILNVLLYIEIQKFAQRRKEMNVKNKKEIQAVKMFIPVVVVLFLCNIEPYVHYYYIAVEGYVYREHFLGVFLSVSLNSFVNFFFYMRADSFRNEFRDTFSSCCCYTLIKRSGTKSFKDVSQTEKSTGASILTVSNGNDGHYKAKGSESFA